MSSEIENERNSGERLARQRRRDTKAEVELRRRIHARGLRYRVDVGIRGLPRRRVDIVFSKARVAVLVDGCFWHGCPIHSTVPRTNTRWWQEKIAGNIDRDRDTDAVLSQLGWSVVRVWEHENPDVAADKVESAVRRARLWATPPDPAR